MPGTELFRGMSGSWANHLAQEPDTLVLSHAPPFGGASVTPASSTKVRGPQMQVIVFTTCRHRLFAKVVDAQVQVVKVLFGFVFVFVKAYVDTSITMMDRQYLKDQKNDVNDAHTFFIIFFNGYK